MGGPLQCEMGKLDDKVIVVTGASSGIGAAVAKCLAAEGAMVALLARRKDKLEALATEINAYVSARALPSTATSL